jgi:uncharacterized protein YhaN
MVGFLGGPIRRAARGGWLQAVSDSGSNGIGQRRMSQQATSEYLDALRKAAAVKREIDAAADSMLRLRERAKLSQRVDQAVWEIHALAREGRNDVNSQRQCTVIRSAIQDVAAPIQLSLEELTVKLDRETRRADLAEAKAAELDAMIRRGAAKAALEMAELSKKSSKSSVESLTI